MLIGRCEAGTCGQRTFLFALLLYGSFNPIGTVANRLLSVKDICQTNPFYSCGPAAATNSIRMTLRVAQHLSGADASAISVTGLSGAGLDSAEVSLRVNRVSDQCEELGGMKMVGVSETDKCFLKLDSNMRGWEDAENACHSWGGHLATIESSVENRRLSSFLGTSTWVWIGYRNKGWSDGSNVTFDNLVLESEITGNASSSGGTGCAAFNSGSWFDLPCSLPLQTLCFKHLRDSPPLFCVAERRRLSTWDSIDADGTLTLSLCKDKRIEANTTYTVEFSVNNRPFPQKSPSIHILATGTLDSLPILMDHSPNQCGTSRVPDATLPLLITTPQGYLDTREGTCTKCREGYWCPGWNQSVLCPGNSTSPEGSDQPTDCFCLGGFSGPPGGPCEQCPADTFCFMGN
eukprot:937912-Rhodomonas_salina.2